MQQPPFDPVSYPPQPLPPRKKSRKKPILFGCLGAIVLVLAIIVIAAVATGGGASQATTLSATPTADRAVTQATTAPTTGPTTLPTATSAAVRPTATPTHSVQASGPATLGGPVAAFIAKYGPSDTGCASCTAGIYAFKRYPGTQLDYLEVMLTDSDAAHQGHVNAFLVQAPPNADWDTATATAICESFGPSDASYGRAVRVITAPDGSSVQKIYQSTWLAQQLVSSDFTDTSANPVAPGTFSLYYSYDSPNHVSSCSVEAGIPAS